jgi:hypothetical protein
MVVMQLYLLILLLLSYYYYYYYSPLPRSCRFVDPPLLVLLLLVFSSPVLCSYFSYSSPLLSSSTITVFLDINLGEEIAELSSPNLPDNYAFDLGFRPTLGRANHPYPSIVSNMF